MLNEVTAGLVDAIISSAEGLRISASHSELGTRLVDFGCESIGSIEAGLALAQVCMAGQCDIRLQRCGLGSRVWPYISVTNDRPVESCLLSQYAGWQLANDEYFGMGSGPMRAAGSQEDLFEELGYNEEPQHAVGVIESGQLPPVSIQKMIAEQCGVQPDKLTLCVAPTASQAGNIQVVARSVETSLHKLHELNFDLRRIVSGWGSAPLPPVARNDIEGIGRTNDAILYGGTVHLWVTGDDESLESLGPQIPSNSSDAFGSSFLDLFEAAGRDFYALDAHLFSPAVVMLHNLDTGTVLEFGELRMDIVQKSFGLKTSD